MGETVRVLGTAGRGQWWLVRNDVDGYRGWVRSWGLTSATPAEARRWTAAATAQARLPFVEVREGRGRGPLVSPLFWQARVIVRRRAGKWSRVQLPDGRQGWVPSRALTPGSRRPTLERRIQSLLGLPYSWGGRTPSGFDCSGFVQQVMAEQGIDLPRDADEQRRATTELGPGDRPRRGDLVFFGPKRGRLTHVGILLGGGRFAHAQGQVAIGTLDDSNPLYNKRLHDILRGFGRPLWPPRGGGAHSC